MLPHEVPTDLFPDSELDIYANIPKNIDHLTYELEENGVKISRKFSVQAKALYKEILMRNANVIDWEDIQELSITLNCSVENLIAAKFELMQPISQLSGICLMDEVM